MKTDVKPKKISFFDSTEHHTRGSDCIIGVYTVFLTVAFLVDFAAG